MTQTNTKKKGTVAKKAGVQKKPIDTAKLTKTESPEKLLKEKGLLLKNFPDLQDNDKAVMIAVKQNGKAIQYASKRLKTDKRIAKAAVKSNPRAYYMLSAELRKDPGIAAAAVAVDGEVFINQLMPKELQDNRKVAEALVKNHNSGLLWLSEEMRNDKRIAMLAAGKDPFALAHLSDELKDDEDVVKVAISQEDNGSMLLYASERLKKDRNMILLALKNDKRGTIASEFFLGYSGDVEVCMTALESCERKELVLKYIDDKMQKKIFGYAKRGWKMDLAKKRAKKARSKTKPKAKKGE